MKTKSRPQHSPCEEHHHHHFMILKNKNIILTGLNTLPPRKITIVCVGPNAWQELTVLLRALVTDTTVQAHISVLFDCKPPENMVRLFMDLGVRFHQGILERTVNLIIVGVPRSDVIIMLNGKNNC
jgi:hypothetical protein